MLSLKPFSRLARRGAVCAALLFLALALAPLPGLAQGLPPAATAQALIARAQAQGEIRVIVGLDLQAAPEGQLSPQQLDAQRAAIAAAQQQVLGALNAPDAVRFETIPYVSLRLTPDQLETLLATPGVTSVVEDIPVPPNLTDSTQVISARAVWRAGVTGAGWRVAVLDTGVYYGHRAFRDAIPGSACFSTNWPEHGATSLCRGGVEREIHRRAAPSCDTSIVGCGHGTHVSSIAAGHQPRALRGVAHGAEIIAVQVFSRFPADYPGCRGMECVLSYQTDQIAALEHVARLARSQPIAAVNLSLGGGGYNSSSLCDGFYPAYTDVVTNLRSRGVAVVASSGNSGYAGYIGFPACITNIIAVGATDIGDNIAAFSNQAEGLTELMAPGVNIRAAYEGTPLASEALNGTSMAAPHVAGAIALLREVAPDASVDAIVAALACTGAPVTRANTTGTFQRINLQRARAELRFGRLCR